MAIFRAVFFILLFACAVSFAFYAVTSEARYKRLGLLILKWTLVAGFVFFGVLIAERLMFAPV